MATKKSSPKSKAKKSSVKAKAPVVHSVEVDEPIVAIKPVAKRDILARLRVWNLVLAGLYAAQAAAIILLSVSKLIPVSVSYLAREPLQSAAQDKTVLVSATHFLFDVNLVYMVAAFLVLAAGTHLFVATKHRAKYEAGLGQGFNRVRWLSCTVSASLMMLVVGLVSGVQDIALLITLFGLIAVTSLCGLAVEAYGRFTISYITGCIAGAIAWIGIALYVFGGAVYGDMPAITYWIFGSVLAVSIALAVNVWLGYKKIGKWADYTYVERVYMVLGFAAVSLLTWQVFAGALRP